MKLGDVIRIGEGNGTEIRVRFSEFKGKHLVDVRKWYYNPPDDASAVDTANKPAEFYSPTAKGISMTVPKFLEVMEVLVGVYEEFKEAKS